MSPPIASICPKFSIAAAEMPTKLMSPPESSAALLAFKVDAIKPLTRTMPVGPTVIP